MVAVGYFTAHLTGTFAEMDADKAGLSRGDAMFEGILYEGDENEWGYFRTAIGTDIDWVSTVTLEARRIRISSI